MLRVATLLTRRGRRSLSSVALVKELRQKTGAPILECKKALAQEGVDGDLDKAVDYLRTMGVAAAAKRAGNTASEGLVAVATSACGGRAVAVELNSETDFVARNELFQTLLGRIADTALEVGHPDADGGATTTLDITSALLEHPMGDGETVGSAVELLSGTVRENIGLRRAALLSAGPDARIGTYVHNTMVPGMGGIGCAVAIQADGESFASGAAAGEGAAGLEAMGTQVSLHVAAARPLYLNVDAIPEEDLERERAVLMEQGLQSGKPENIVEKMVVGRMRKYYEETALENQKSVMDADATVISKLVQQAHPKAKLAGFFRVQVGEEL